MLQDMWEEDNLSVFKLNARIHTMLPNPNIKKVLVILDSTYPTLPMHEIHGHDAFQMLVAVILSQRSRDSVTVPTAALLFQKVHTPQEFIDMPIQELEDVIRPIGFYRDKARAIVQMCQTLVDQYDGQVPRTEEELLSLPQVGRKTANIMLTTFFDTPQIAVDIHVHRITNRLGWVATSKVEDTEVALTQRVPKKFHSIVNRVFVAHGQQVCLPRHPKCAQCPIESYCPRIGVS